MRERDHRRPRGDRVALRPGREDGTRDHRCGARIDLSASRGPAAGSGGGRAGRQHQRRLSRGRRRRHGADRHGGGPRASRRLGPHRRRRRRLGSGPGVQRRDRGLHRARRPGGRGRGRAADGARGGAPDQRRDRARVRRRRSAAGARIVVKPDGSIEGTLGDPAIDAEAIAAARELLATPTSEIRTFPGASERSSRSSSRRSGCWCAAPDTTRSRSCGRPRHRLEPVVVDDRPGFLNLERFPEAAGFVHVEAPEHVSKTATIDRRTHAVGDDAQLPARQGVPAVVPRFDAGYIGMLGPSARTHRLLMELAEEGVEITDDDRARIHGPAGLDLGARARRRSRRPIVAEIVAARHGRAAGSSRNAPARSTIGRPPAPKPADSRPSIGAADASARGRGPVA